MRPVLIALVTASSVLGIACRTDESAASSRRMAVGQVTARLSQPDSATLFESLQALAVAPDARSVYVLDRLARRVHRVSVDGAVLGEMGREGSGPGEFENATAIRAVQRGVWVLDAEAGRFLLFSPDGAHLKTVTPNVQWPLSLTFAALNDGLVFPSFSSFQTPSGDQSLLAYTPFANEDIVAVRVPGSIPAELAAGSDLGSVVERQTGWLLHTVSPGVVALVLNQRNPSIWLMKWQDDRVADLYRVLFRRKRTRPFATGSLSFHRCRQERSCD